MSDNYRLYQVKMAELKERRAASRPLNAQLVELMAFVKACEERSRSPLSGS